MVGRPPVRALDELSLQVARGEVVGVAGPNGAGKSTLIAVLLGYLHPTSGAVQLDGVAPRRYIERHGVGYLSELIGINPRWRTDRVLERYALLAGLSDADVVRRVDELMELLGLDEHRTKPVKALSKGNLQRLGVAQALLGDPDLIILDEPTHGFDPMWTLRFRRVIADLRRPGRTMLIASHDLAELSALTDRVVILDHGRVVRTVDTAAKAPVLRDYRLTVAAGASEVVAVFPDARAMGDATFEMRQIELDALNVGLAEFLRRGGHIVSVGPSESLLEYHFRDAVEELNP
ncbi:MAG TPA: ABC transporter ATP-binding protein [Gemmatimonadaceae bacterium]|nr:ABC transporter ATP-binding protein [Gemmatimonadaceae bacterium]